MRFEFDPRKSISNHEKHGIDFVEAQALWSDPLRIETAGKTLDEPRSIVTGEIRQILWSAVITYRHEETTIRIISVRRAHPQEEARYRAAGRE
jgi:uncharacterized protein